MILDAYHIQIRNVDNYLAEAGKAAADVTIDPDVERILMKYQLELIERMYQRRNQKITIRMRNNYL